MNRIIYNYCFIIYLPNIFLNHFVGSLLHGHLLIRLHTPPNKPVGLQNPCASMFEILLRGFDYFQLVTNKQLMTPPRLINHR